MTPKKAQLAVCSRPVDNTLRRRSSFRVALEWTTRHRPLCDASRSRALRRLSKPPTGGLNSSSSRGPWRSCPQLHEGFRKLNLKPDIVFSREDFDQFSCRGWVLVTGKAGGNVLHVGLFSRMMCAADSHRHNRFSDFGWLSCEKISLSVPLLA